MSPGCSEICIVLFGCKSPPSGGSTAFPLGSDQVSKWAKSHLEAWDGALSCRSMMDLLNDAGLFWYHCLRKLAVVWEFIPSPSSTQNGPTTSLLTQPAHFIIPPHLAGTSVELVSSPASLSAHRLQYCINVYLNTAHILQFVQFAIFAQDNRFIYNHL